jgi:tetratricopeptide (TPR) repeat protein
MEYKKSIEIQKQIRENSTSIQDYFKDLLDWQKEINAKDKLINTNFKSKVPKTYNTIETSKDDKDENSDNNKLIKENLKRDVNSIKDYYNQWDKFNLDEELATIDGSNENTKLKKMMKSETSKASKNSNITITNKRVLSNSEDYIDKLKNEANAYFAIKNFNKSIELYNSALELIGKDTSGKYDKAMLVIFNNKGNSYLKQNLFKEAINDFNIVLAHDKRNTKALFRRGYCYMRLEQFNLAFGDFVLAKEYTENDSEVKLIKDNIEQCVKEMNSVIIKEKKKLERFEYDDKTKFKKIKIYEVSAESFGQIVKPSEKVVSVEVITKKPQNKPTISHEEIIKFVYDFTKENLTASSFKYALRNFKNVSEKTEFLKVAVLNLEN